jgi:LCP family protein required for cell wall assembly
VLIGFGVFLTVISGVVVIGSKLLVAQVSNNIQKGNFLATPQPNAKLDGPLNILLVGNDSRLDDNTPDSEGHADTEVIVHVTAAHDKAYLVSIPRDLEIQAPPFPPSGYTGGRAKMTEAFFWGEQNGQGTNGGMQELTATIQQRFGITLNAAALINFDGMQQVIDAMGGIDMCFDETVTSKHTVTQNGKIVNIGDQPNPWAFGTPVVYKQGDCWNNMPGWAALDYSRQRYFMSLNDGDYGRQRHQQQVLRAILKKATSAGMITNPGKLASVISAAGKTLTLDLGGIHIEDFLFTLGSIGTSQLTTLKTNAGQFDGVQINGISYEQLTPASEDMFKAVVNDDLATFVASHPEFVVPAS